MIKVGLTGSIGMGKSTTARMFAEAGVPVHDADATVHALYAGRAVPLIEEAFPGTIIDGKVDRTLLSSRVVGEPAAMARLEKIVHPLVREEETKFLAKAQSDRKRITVLDIPLLFETGGDRRVDMVVVVTADADVQRSRVLSRPGMTEERFVSILGKQMADSAKRARAHFLVDTGLGISAAQRAVQAILKAIAGCG